jgi:predicted nucleotide-binding protein (sugar kinase/HSP70/actin superfamily)
VKGPRKVGKKVFLQGGVAKNSSIAYAFALATAKHIIVPPNPELMGAYGVALMAYEKYENGLLESHSMNISKLLSNEMKILGNFTCRSCDNYCVINRYSVGARKFPFGGKCSKYESQWKNIDKGEEVEDHVSVRNAILFSVIDNKPDPDGIKIGIPRALTTHTLFPLYYSFLRELGFNVVLSGIDDHGELYINAPFCFPTQIAHGAVLDLIRQDKPDYVFFPQIQKMPYEASKINSYLCPISQASPFVLQKAFSDVKFLSPSLNFQQGYLSCDAMIKSIVDEFDMSSRDVEWAYTNAVDVQLTVEFEMRKLGMTILKEAIASDKPAIILVGRSYNAFPNETSQSIGRKLASKGISTIPFDCLGPQNNAETSWYFSNLIINAVRLAQQHDNLFILYISNFGCNIDSFTLEYLRVEMGNKPYLKLDIDSHTADAGTLTRIEAYLEIIQNYRLSHKIVPPQSFNICKLVEDDGEYHVRTSSGEKLKLEDKRIKFHFPVFSKYHSEIFPVVFRWVGYNAADPVELSVNQLDRGLQYTSGNECLPMPIYIGQLLEIYENREPGEITGLYMIAGGAPCVVASYTDLLNQFIEENEMDDIFLFTPHLTWNKLYNMSKIDLFKHFPVGVCLGDIMIEIHNVLEVVSDKKGLQMLADNWRKLLENSGTRAEFDEYFPQFIDRLGEIPLYKDPQKLPKVVVTGDFFVRFDPFFFQGLVERYAKHDIILKPVDLSEILIYGPRDDMMIYSNNFDRPVQIKKGLLKAAVSCTTSSSRNYMASWVYAKVLEKVESNIRGKFMGTNLLVAEQNNVDRIIDYASEHVDPSITGETVLTVGKAVEAMREDYDGVMVLGPFACLPFRISEGILKPLFLENDFAFISYETDGRAVPPAFLRLVDVHIQQILRNYGVKTIDTGFTRLTVHDST